MYLSIVENLARVTENQLKWQEPRSTFLPMWGHSYQSQGKISWLNTGDGHGEPWWKSLILKFCSKPIGISHWLYLLLYLVMSECQNNLQWQLAEVVTECCRGCLECWGMNHEIRKSNWSVCGQNAKKSFGSKACKLRLSDFFVWVR